jgi:glucose/arabinose dehydrogenase
VSRRTRVYYLLAALALTAALGLDRLLAGRAEATPPPPPLAQGPGVALARVVGGLRFPVDLQSARDGTGRLFVVEQDGRIRVLQGGQLAPTPFLDISARVASGGELGLLGLAFHPRYRENGRLFLNYTRSPRRRKHETAIVELRVSEDPQRAGDEERLLLAFEQPWANHNGGQVAFGPDGLLYIGTGDGGAANDPLGSGQDTRSLLGKLLRIDVDGEEDGRPYRIPADNPFAKAGGRAEIFAFGLRNPWRFSWDRERPERLFVGDVGQNKWEEVHLVAKGDNCGWNVMEGAHCFQPSKGCDQRGLRLPICEYSHEEGKSVTGGFVYRGQAIPDLRGVYVFCDYYPGPIWGLREREDGTWERLVLGQHEALISAFGEDDQGELYLLDHQGGAVLRLEAAPRKASF